PGVPSATIPPRAGAGRATGRTGGMRWPIIAIVGAIAVIVVGLVVALSGGGDESEPARTQEPNVVVPPPSNTTAEEPVQRGDVTVAVLNGTSVTGLAKRVASRIEGSGFDVPDDLVTNAVEQNRSATVVMYVEGARDEAREVAKVIDVGSDAVTQIDESTRVITQGRARVVVTVGADQGQQ
ncbi:MAG: LytR C-terminal domain-containing protein, partial [Actinomycetota bacterium]|nr:LytR C-terminal domain-containing protein [Actinomycetota bacterium]MDQ5808629.1 LytR C-terminal domain-containing protein [Actinomycetota bacterium]